MRLQALFALVCMTGFGSAEADTSRPPPASPDVESPTAADLIAPADLGSPCYGSVALADRQATAFSIDFFTLGSNGYAPPPGQPGTGNDVLGPICRLADFPVGLD